MKFRRRKIFSLLWLGIWLAALFAPVRAESPAPTPTPTPYGYDIYEVNDTPEQAVLVGVGVALEATLHHGDVDWWQVYLKAGRSYRLEAVARPGGDPRLALYSATLVLLAENDDCAAGSYSPCLHYQPPADGFYYLEVRSQVAGLYAAYTLRISEALPTPTPSPTPTATPGAVPTPQPTATPNDSYENNYSFETAAEITVGQTVNANLPVGDNDFFRLFGKPGVVYRCDVQPQPGLDTNLIVYDANRNVIGGNDDRAPGDPASSFSWQSSYHGWVYLLIGPVAGQGAYTLRCEAVAPTPTLPPAPPALPGVPSLPIAAPATPTPIWIPTPTATPGANWSAPLPPPQPPIKVVVYYDENYNNAAEPQEGIAGATVLLLDATTNRPLAWLATDANGYVQFDAPASIQLSSGYGGSSGLRISIPYLGFSRAVSAGQVIEVRVKAQTLPGLLP